MKPSTSTVASFGLGVPAAIVVAWVLNEFGGVQMPDYVQTALGALISAGIGYAFKGGRAADTED